MLLDKPKKHTLEALQLKGFVEQLHDQMLSFNPPNKFKILEATERPRLRGSNLPVCPVQVMLDTLRPVPRTQASTFTSDYYTRVGSTYHEVIQKWFGVSGCMYGKFRCPECQTLYPLNSKVEDNQAMLGPVMCDCGSKRKHSTRKFNSKLPVCCEYVELEPYGTDGASSFHGHTDGIAFINNKYVVLEFKTTSAAKITKRRKEGPDHKHVLQAAAYRRVLPKFLEMDDDLWAKTLLVIYYDRANPRNNVVCPVPYEYDKFQAEIDTFVKTQRRIKKKLYKKIRGKCISQKDDPYCPYNALCFSPQRDKLIDEIIPGYLKCIEHIKQFKKSSSK